MCNLIIIMPSKVNHKSYNRTDKPRFHMIVLDVPGTPHSSPVYYFTLYTLLLSGLAVYSGCRFK